MIENIDKLKNNIVDLIYTDCNDCRILKNMLYKALEQLDIIIPKYDVNNLNDNFARVSFCDVKEKLILIEKIIDFINYDYNINDCFKNILKDIIVTIASLD